MIADKQFLFVLTDEQKQQLEYVASRERRSKGNLIKSLIAERYEQLTRTQPVTDPQRDQMSSNRAVMV